MKYLVTRTSTDGGSEEVKPCSGAVPGNYVCKSTGRREPGWFIRIDSISVLMKFVKRNGEIIIGPRATSCYPTIEIYDDYQ